MQNIFTTSVQSDKNNLNLLTQWKFISEELEEREKKLIEILKFQVQNTNERLVNISNEVLEIRKSLKFTQGKTDEELAIVKSDILKIKP